MNLQLRIVLRSCGICVFVLGICGFLWPQSSPAPGGVKVKVRAALYDRDLNLKPVPHLEVKLIPALPGAQTLTVQTTLDGIAEIELLAGKYKVVTDKPVELFDKSYRWEFDVQFAKPENTLELSNDNAHTTPLAGGREAHIDELAFQYKRVKDAVVTVWTEHGAYDAVVVDPAGLVLTVQRPLEHSAWLAVQVDDRRRLPAVIAAADKEHDIAVLRINPFASGEIVSAQPSTDPGALVEGERVFTVENPDWQKNRKLITGVLSKADAAEIVSDVKLSSGGALFNSSGSVVGVGHIVQKKSSIQPIATASAVLAEARQKLSASAPPSSQLLPSPPVDKFPTDSLRAPGRDHWEKDVYSSQIGDFIVEFYTPVSRYEIATQNYAQDLKEYGKHSKGRSSPPAEPENKYDAVLIVSAMPKTKAPFWENMTASSGNRGLIQRFKTEFEKMRLLCGEKELTPIWPGRVALDLVRQNSSVVTDESSMGRYTYSHDAVSPQCGKVTLQVFSAKDPEHPFEKVLDQSLITRLWQDFEPYRKLKAGATPPQ